jgi:hypothetical protein
MSEHDSRYTVTLNQTTYNLNEEIRSRIETRAKNEYEGNRLFSCWWTTASAEKAEESDIHEEGDPLLIIETEGTAVPWERLDQLQVEDESVESFEGVDTGSDEDGEPEEKNRTHFGVTPTDYEEIPSPDGEEQDKVPAKPNSFDEPKLVVFVPENPDKEHTWGTGEALAPMYNWVEWNVQAKADQPRLDQDDSHNHWESILNMDECKVLEEDVSQESSETQSNTDDMDTLDGKRGGDNWRV